MMNSDSDLHCSLASRKLERKLRKKYEEQHFRLTQRLLLYPRLLDSRRRHHHHRCREVSRGSHLNVGTEK